MKHCYHRLMMKEVFWGVLKNCCSRRNRGSNQYHYRDHFHHREDCEEETIYHLYILFRLYSPSFLDPQALSPLTQVRDLRVCWVVVVGVHHHYYFQQVAVVLLAF